MQRWPATGFHAQHSWELYARGEIDLYAGRGREAFAYVSEPVGAAQAVDAAAGFKARGSSRSICGRAPPSLRRLTIAASAFVPARRRAVGRPQAGSRKHGLVAGGGRVHSRRHQCARGRSGRGHQPPSARGARLPGPRHGAPYRRRPTATRSPVRRARGRGADPCRRRLDGEPGDSEPGPDGARCSRLASRHEGNEGVETPWNFLAPRDIPVDRDAP